MGSVKRTAARAFLALVFAVPAAAQSRPQPTYGHDIAPILYRSCTSCHRPGESGPFPLLSYDDAKHYAPQIAAAVRTRSMPPWLPEHGYGDFANESLSTRAKSPASSKGSRTVPPRVPRLRSRPRRISLPAGSWALPT